MVCSLLTLSLSKDGEDENFCFIKGYDYEYDRAVLSGDNNDFETDVTNGHLLFLFYSVAARITFPYSF